MLFTNFFRNYGRQTENIMDIAALIEKAKGSAFYLKLLNLGLNRMIPFNRPHGFRILSLSDDRIETLLPYKKKNLNHVKGLHACALATLCEFTTGAMMLSRAGFNRYRIILKSMEVEYLYQGKMDATARFEITDAWLREFVFTPLEHSESVLVECPVDIHDRQNNHLASAKVIWQLKEWSKVRLK